jgi:Uma2 family endonuclease
MVAELLTGQPPSREFAELLRPERLPDGTEPEERMILCGVSWKRYLKLDKALGDERPGPRFYYLDGDLEIMTTSNEHERIKSWIRGLLEIYFDELGGFIMPRGQATMRLAMKEAGAEPDESWCLGAEKQFPDLVLEIALTSGGVNKLEVYRRFAVPEVWLWRRNALEIFALRSDGSAYDRAPRSRLLPQLDVGLLERCVKIPSWQKARRAFRAGLAAKA